MPRFHLHIVTPDDRIDDEEGLDLPDLAAARTEAICGLRSIVSHEALAGRLSIRDEIEIENEAGERLMTVRCGEALDLPPELAGIAAFG